MVLFYSLLRYIRAVKELLNVAEYYTCDTQKSNFLIIEGQVNSSAFL